MQNCILDLNLEKPLPVFFVCKLNLCVFQVSRKDFEGFKNLFHRFLQVKGPSVEWIKIQRPPEDSVSVVNMCLSVRVLVSKKRKEN